MCRCVCVGVCVGVCVRARAYGCPFATESIDRNGDVLPLIESISFSTPIFANQKQSLETSFGDAHVTWTRDQSTCSAYSQVRLAAAVGKALGEWASFT